ncbi:MAG: shikimate dehydrogenase [Gammaproteobacteria bacterium]|nr:MAG: shikimate dehydrogenase [Gammaproteobacteria bacterium]
MTDRYAVVGNPVGHSLSPFIHTRFAEQTGQDLVYTAIEAPLDGFDETVHRFAAEGGRGMNVTVPFKSEAAALADKRSAAVYRAGAANTLSFDEEGLIRADNTDGVGLLRDLEDNLGVSLEGRRILVLGAGGAVRGVLEPLLARQPGELLVANRTAERARDLARDFADLGPVRGLGLDEVPAQPFDVVINGTAAGLAAEVPAVPEAVIGSGTLAYDMMYRRDGETAFTAWARALGAGAVADGLGMLVEQAAEAFFIWRGVRPETGPVLAELRG